MTRRYSARSGTRTPAAASTAWQKASEWPTVVSPEMRSASSTPAAGARPSKSFSVPLWVKYSRDFMSMIVSPTTLKRKCPGSMIPACTGPTGISYTPSPPTSVKGKARPSSVNSRGTASLRSGK